MKHKENADITGDLTGDIVANNLCYCNKTNLDGDLVGAKVSS
jgi:hypothetical protein